MATKEGYLDFRRREFNSRSVEDRCKDFDEFIILNDEIELKRQAARCMGCDIPFCFSLGCPLHNLIPEFNDRVLHKDIQGAYELLIHENPFPEITGRVCPALCETSCSLSISMAPVTIKQLELYIIEKAFDMGLVESVKLSNTSGKSVGIIGSGPAGLAAADQLNKHGYDVTIYEKKKLAGGLLRYGIPNYKLPKWVLDRRVEVMMKSGIKFETNIEVGKDIEVSELKRRYHSILLAIGAEVPRNLELEGRYAEGIHFALDYLGQPNHLKKQVKINAFNKNVLVIGGGDTGSDCVGTARRQGANCITQIEILPKQREWHKSYNPEWPNYPRIHRTSSSHLEGCKREFSVNTRHFVVEKGYVKGAVCEKVEWIKDKTGNLKMNAVPNSQYFINAELILIAMGFLHIAHTPLLSELGVKYDSKGMITQKSLAELKKNGVFLAGDSVLGASLVVKSIKNGINVALEMDK